MNYRKGFTLIELLVVIAIISVLSSVVLSSLSEARIKAKNSVRVQQLKQVQTALEIYYANHGSYPVSRGTVVGHRTWINECDSLFTGFTGFIIPELVSEKLFPGINDPVDCSGGHYGYSYGSDGKNYKFISHSEQIGGLSKEIIDPASDDGGWGEGLCVVDGTNYQHFGVWSDGGKCWIENWECPLDPDLAPYCLQ